MKQDWMDGYRPYRFGQRSRWISLWHYTVSAAQGFEFLFYTACIFIAGFLFGLGIAWVTMKDVIC